MLDGLQELYMRREVGAAAGEHVGPQLAQLSSSGKLGSDTGSCHWRRWCATQQSRLLPGGRWYLTPLAVASTVAAAPCIAAGRRGPLARQHGSSRLVRSINCQHVTDGLYGLSEAETHTYVHDVTDSAQQQQLAVGNRQQNNVSTTQAQASLKVSRHPSRASHPWIQHQHQLRSPHTAHHCHLMSDHTPLPRCHSSGRSAQCWEAGW